jgi:hypothetical protein
VSAKQFCYISVLPKKGIIERSLAGYVPGVHICPFRDEEFCNISVTSIGSIV